MTDRQFEEITKKLDLLTRITALLLVADKQQKEQVALLDQAGFQPKVIAEIVGTTSNTVRVRLSSIRSQNKGKRRRINGKAKEKDNQRSDPSGA